jgi:hypothetical protein
MQSLDEYDDWDTEEHRSYEPAVKGVYMGYEMSSCCGDGSLSIPQQSRVSRKGQTRKFAGGCQRTPRSRGLIQRRY